VKLSLDTRIGPACTTLPYLSQSLVRSLRVQAYCAEEAEPLANLEEWGATWEIFAEGRYNEHDTLLRDNKLLDKMRMRPHYKSRKSTDSVAVVVVVGDVVDDVVVGDVGDVGDVVVGGVVVASWVVA
jgi:hypothetical protein